MHLLAPRELELDGGTLDGSGTLQHVSRRVVGRGRIVLWCVPCAEVDCGDLEWGLMKGGGDEKLALGREGGRGSELVECLSNDVDRMPIDPIE